MPKGSEKKGGDLGMAPAHNHGAQLEAQDETKKQEEELLNPRNPIGGLDWWFGG